MQTFLPCLQYINVLKHFDIRPLLDMVLNRVHRYKKIALSSQTGLSNTNITIWTTTTTRVVSLKVLHHWYGKKPVRYKVKNYKNIGGIIVSNSNEIHRKLVLDGNRQRANYNALHPIMLETRWDCFSYYIVRTIHIRIDNRSKRTFCVGKRKRNRTDCLLLSQAILKVSFL